MAFRGSFDFTLDAKNRLTIPVRFRGPFADGVVLARMHDSDDCVSVWCTADFDEHVKSLLAGFHPLSKEHAELTRFLNVNSHDTELDAAGRVMVPGKLLTVAGLDKDVVVNGVGNRLEVWARGVWEQTNDALASAVKEIRPADGHTP
jgi:MraZ protein